jgi:opacity protein-like surface antigen
MGAGVGLVVGMLHINDSGLDFKDSDTTFGYQALIGLNYHLSSQADLSLAYKFLGIDFATLSGIVGGAGD